MPRADGLKPAQVKALEVLLRGGTSREAAEASGADPRTVRRWKSENDQFKEAIEEAAGAALDDLRFRITMALEKVIGAAEKIIDDPKATPSVKAQAMNQILQIARSLDVLKGDGSSGDDTPDLKKWIEKKGETPL